MGIFIETPQLFPALAPGTLGSFSANSIPGPNTIVIGVSNFSNLETPIVPNDVTGQSESKEIVPINLRIIAGTITEDNWAATVPSPIPSFSRTQFASFEPTVVIEGDFVIDVSAPISPATALIAELKSINAITFLEASPDEIATPDFLPKGEVVGSQAIILNGSLIPTFNVKQVTQETAIVNGITRLMPIGRTEGSSANVVMTVDDDIVVT